jgi:hypothetical protein
LRLSPHFRPGQALRYQMDMRTTWQVRSSGLVEDPQAPSKLEISTSFVVRLEVLSVDAGAAEPGAAGGNPMRLRTTYEKVAATTHSDIYDPAAEELAEQYRRLEGRSVELTLDAQGKVVDSVGLEEILKDPRAVVAARNAFAQLAGGGGLPQEGIVPGDKWSVEQAIEMAPLVGLSRRVEATYLRNEPCRLPLPARPGGPAAAGTSAEKAATVPDAPGASCAVILTRFEISHRDSPHDPTPEEYRKRGLRTAGKYGGSGESLAYVSLASGWVVSVTQEASEEMDFTVTASEGESKARYAGRVTTQISLALLAD